MSFKECRRIELQAFDLFDRIERIHRQHPAVPENIRDKYILLFKVLEETAYELTAEATLAFANLFSRLDYIGKAKKMTPSDRYAIQTMRRNCNKAMGNRFQPDMQEYLYDLRALARFVSVGFGEDIPASLLAEIPRSNRPYTNASLAHIPYVRAYVTSWNDSLIFASSDSENEPFIIVNYEKAGYNGDLLYIRDLLRENLPLNLLDVKVDEENQDFARRLFRRTILNADYYRHLISENSKNWDLSRVAVMDVVVMQIALAEILSFPNIPINVSLNEYVEIAKLYSTPKSGGFINGTLDGIVKRLKKENKLIKN